jgi:hypothetical protein
VARQQPTHQVVQPSLALGDGLVQASALHGLATLPSQHTHEQAVVLAKGAILVEKPGDCPAHAAADEDRHRRRRAGMIATGHRAWVGRRPAGV